MGKAFDGDRFFWVSRKAEKVCYGSVLGFLMGAVL
jgi:hypothetical protein